MARKGNHPVLIGLSVSRQTRDHPATARILLGTMNDDGFGWCSATLTGCANPDSVYPPEILWVFLQHAGTWTVSEVRVHPNAAIPGRDIAVLKSATTVTGVTPMPINDVTPLPQGTTGTIVGCSRSETSYGDPGVKRFGRIETIDRATLEEQIPGIEFNNEDLICWGRDGSGHRGEPSNKCHGDSKGPLFATVPSTDGPRRVVAIPRDARLGHFTMSGDDGFGSKRLAFHAKRGNPLAADDNDCAWTSARISGICAIESPLPGDWYIRVEGAGAGWGGTIDQAALQVTVTALDVPEPAVRAKVSVVPRARAISPGGAVPYTYTVTNQAREPLDDSLPHRFISPSGEETTFGPESVRLGPRAESGKDGRLSSNEPTAKPGGRWPFLVELENPTGARQKTSLQIIGTEPSGTVQAFDPKHRSAGGCVSGTTSSSWGSIPPGLAWSTSATRPRSRLRAGRSSDSTGAKDRPGS